VSRILFIILASVLSSFAAAAERGIEFSGFGSIGLAASSSEQLGFRRDINDPGSISSGDTSLGALSVLGLQLNAGLNNQLDAVVQLTFRDAVKQNSNSILRLAALSYSPNDDWKIRLGRTSPRIFLLSDSRLISYSNLWTMPVQEFYGPLIVNYADGFDITHSLNRGPGVLRTSLSYGSTELEYDDPVFDPARIKLNSALAFSVEYDAFDWLLRIAYAYAKDGENFQELESLRSQLRGLSTAFNWSDGMRLADDFSFEDGRIDYWSVGGKSNFDKLELVSEYTWLNSDIEFLPASEAAYVSAAWHFQEWVPYITLAAVSVSDSYELQEPPPAAAAQLAYLTVSYLDSRFEQESLSVGVRWDFGLNKALKFQWDHKKVQDGAYGLWAPVDLAFPEGEQEVDVFTISLDFIF
jgi:hypothetical protein